MGGSAVFRCGRTEKPTSQVHPAYFESVDGLSGKRVIFVKSAHHFRVGFIPLTKPGMILEVDTPGVSNPDPKRFSYKSVRRPIFP